MFAGRLLLIAAAAAAGLREIPPPGRLVDIGGARLHIHCTGTGSPAVILESGFPGSSLDWVRVQPEAARFTQTCGYDRAGLGWSEPGAEPRSSIQIAADPRTLLDKAGIAGPYVMVGHSLGGRDA